MPYCCAGTRLAAPDNAVKLFYRTYGHGPTKVLLIIGLAGTHESWGPQIEGLTGTFTPNNDETEEERCGCCYQSSYLGIQIIIYRDKPPLTEWFYQHIWAWLLWNNITKIMAKDAIALLDHLGWRKAHFFGHSMGAMIACKLAAMVPDRVLSLALLNVTGGGLECFPKFHRQTLHMGYRFLKAKTPEERAAVDLETHYTREYLEEYVGTRKRRTILCQQYVKGISATGMQSNFGFEGQVNACWTHKVTQTEVELIKSAGFPIAVIHGRHDIIAQIYYARRLAERLQPMARMVELHGGHLVSHERTEEVNQALLDLIKASELKMNAHDWSNLPKKNSRAEKKVLVSKTDIQGGSDVSLMSRLVEKLQLCLFYLFDLLVLPIESGRKLLECLKPVRVGSSPSYVFQ